MTYLRIAGVLVAFAALASAQRGGNDAPSSREATWPAPTADDLKKPCLIKWQRTWEDALALQKETGKPILLCINMDGEIASEHYAGIRYRSPEAAALYEPYICVIASTYRHAPQDYDEEGRRVPCPRFGTVTCGEHIAIEPILFEKYMEGRRIAPRHICIEPDGKESYDVFYAWDVDSVLKTVGDGGKGRPNVPLAKSDRPVTERVAGRDARDRDAVETAFLEGDAERRKALLEAATKAQGAASADLLRLALHGFDPDLAAKARDALAKADSENAVDLIAHALTLPTDPAQREAMIAALERLGARSPRAATLASAHRGLGGRSTAIDLTAWAEALRASAPAGTARSARGLYGWARELDAGVQASDAERRLAAKEATLASDDATAHFELAEALTAKALAPETSDEDLRALMVEAQTVVARAEKLGAYGWRLQSVGATAAWYAGEVDEARRRAESAFADLPADPASWNSMIVLGLFAEARREAIKAAVKKKEPWPAQWLADVHAAYAVLARHPFGDDAQATEHYDFLRFMGAKPQAAQALDLALERFPNSGLLHNRLRAQLLYDGGIKALEATYDARASRPGAPPTERWFAAYAKLLVAENLRRQNRRDEALAAYDRAMKGFEEHLAAMPDTKESCDRHVALCLAGRARIHFERREDAAAVEATLAAFRRRPDAANGLDGLNLSAVDTAKVLQQRLRASGATELLAALEAGMKALDPSMLELPAYERETPASRPASRPRGARR